MESTETAQLPPFLKGFSYLLMVYGAFLVIASGAVLYGCFAFTAEEAGASSISLFSIGAGGLLASALTLALGIVGRMTATRPELFRAARTLCMADMLASAVALLCCNAIGGELPTSLMLNLLLAVVWFVAMRPKAA